MRTLKFLAILLIFMVGVNVYAATEEDFEKAIQDGDLEAVQKALDEGIDVNTKLEHGRTPLILAATYGHLDLVKLLVEEGAAVNATSEYGETALMTAIYSPEIVKFLIEKGADINAQDKNGITALMNAASYGKSDVVRILIDNCADVGLKGNGGETAQLLAELQNHNHIVTIIKAAKRKRVSQKELWEAVKNGELSTVKKALKDECANVNQRNANDETMLMIAAQQGNGDIVSLLLKNGADTNLKNKEGLTALELAKQNNHEEIIETLNEAIQK